MTHRSYAYEHGGLPTNERLEFLGDAVLQLVVTTALFRDHPELPEGQLAKLRASVVNMRALAQIARGLPDGGLGRHLLLGKGEEATGGRNKDSILADTTEALLGAIYTQHGYGVSTDVIEALFAAAMTDAAVLGAGLDWKTSLQEIAATLGLGAPHYRLSDTGPDHAKEFTAVAVISEQDRGTGVGRSKKEAEQIAASNAFRVLSELGAEEPAGRSGSSTGPATEVQQDPATGS